MISQKIREQYARNIAAVSGVQSPALLRAFANVPRENFLGTPPWRTLSVGPGGPANIQVTDVTDPNDLYQNAAVKLDPTRSLTNGNPGTLAPWLDALSVSEGGSV